MRSDFYLPRQFPEWFIWAKTQFLNEQVGAFGVDGDVALAAGGAGGAEYEVVEKRDVVESANFNEPPR